MKLIKLETERDFNKVNHLPFNRDYKVRNDLIQSMNEFGFTVPILLVKTDIMDGTTKMYLVDGQNRMITARFLEIPVYAVVKEIPEIENKEDLVRYVSNLNSKSKQWRMINYVEAYNYLNYPSYEKLLKITNNAPYSVNTIATMLAGGRGRTGNTQAVFDGKFKINDEVGTMEALKFAGQLSKYQKLSSRMLISLKKVMTNAKFDRDKFARKYKANARLVKDMNLDDYSTLFLSWLS